MRTKTIWLLKEDGSVISAAPSLTTARRQLKVLVRHKCWNESTQVQREEHYKSGSRVCFANSNSIYITSTEMIGTAALFQKHFGFPDKFPNEQ